VWGSGGAPERLSLAGWAGRCYREPFDSSSKGTTKQA
jgi:hypothetical protein